MIYPIIFNIILSLHPDQKKQTQEVIFNRKTAKTVHPKIFFNNNPVSKGAAF